MKLNGKTALITGGAGGIGRAAAIKFAQEGARVVIADLNESEGAVLASRLKKEGLKGEFIKCDVSRRSDVEEVIKKTDLNYGRLDAIYNNASVFLSGQDGKITEIEEEAWDKVININLKSIYLFCKYGIPLMMRHGGGSIINTASSAGLIGVPGCDAYTATKGATVQLTKSMAVEYGPFNIRVNCIAPAAIQTEMMRKSNPANSVFDEERFLKLRTPLRRYGTPEEIAELACFLASDESSYINGAVIAADGGITINGDLSRIDTD